ncbi:hypothetical protein N119_01821, partial [Mycobacterium tuberculosis MAL020192]
STSTAATSRRSNSRLPTTLNARDQPPAEVSDQRVSGLTGAVHSSADHQCRPVEDRRTSAGDQPPHRGHPNHRPSVRPEGTGGVLSRRGHRVCEQRVMVSFVGGGVVDDPAQCRTRAEQANARPQFVRSAAADLDGGVRRPSGSGWAPPAGSTNEILDAPNRLSVTAGYRYRAGPAAGPSCLSVVVAAGRVHTTTSRRARRWAQATALPPAAASSTPAPTIPRSKVGPRCRRR